MCKSKQNNIQRYKYYQWPVYNFALIVMKQFHTPFNCKMQETYTGSLQPSELTPHAPIKGITWRIMRLMRRANEGI